MSNIDYVVTGLSSPRSSSSPPPAIVHLIATNASHHRTGMRRTPTQDPLRPLFRSHLRHYRPLERFHRLPKTHHCDQQGCRLELQDAWWPHQPHDVACTTFVWLISSTTRRAKVEPVSQGSVRWWAIRLMGYGTGPAFRDGSVRTRSASFLNQERLSWLHPLRRQVHR